MADETFNFPGQQVYSFFNSAGDLVNQVSTDTTRLSVRNVKPDRDRSRKAPGWLYPKGYNRRNKVTTLKNGLIDYRHRWWGWREVLQGDLHNAGGFSVEAPPFDQTMVTQAEIDALLNVKDQKINLGVAFAEARKTANLVATTATKLASAYSKAKNKDFLGAGRDLVGRGHTTTANNWNELQYGWLPLLGDVYGAAEALAKRDLPSAWLVTGKGVVRRPWNDDYLQGSGLFRSRVRLKGWSGAFVRLDYAPGHDFFSSLGSLGLLNPAEIAWELVPYSFLVDWIWPVGDWLRSLDATVGLTFLSGSVTRRNEVYAEAIAEPEFTDLDLIVSTCYHNAWARDFWLDRSIYWASPIPLPPPLKSPFSSKHVANALSLLAGAVGGRRF